MALALEQPDVGVVPDDHVQVAQLRDLLEEPHVARVEPVVAAGDDHPLSRRQCVASVPSADLRESPASLPAGSTRYSHAVRRGSTPACAALSSACVDHPRRGLRSAVASAAGHRGSIAPAQSVDAIDVADRLEQVQPLGLRETSAACPRAARTASSDQSSTCDAAPAARPPRGTAPAADRRSSKLPLTTTCLTVSSSARQSAP